MEGENILDKPHINRIKWIDVYKGIVITAVVLGHTSGMAVQYVYIFHMAAFFFISGYTERIEEKSMFEIIKNKALSLLLPFFAINFIYLMSRVLMEFLNIQYLFYDERINLSNIGNYVKMLLQVNWTPDLGGASWFLISLFFAFIIAKFLTYITHNKTNIVTVIISLVIWICMYFLLDFKLHFKCFLDLSFNATFYIILGRYSKQKKLLEKVYIKSIGIIVILTGAYLYIFSNILHLTVDYPSRKFNNLALDILSSLIAIILIYNISKRLEKIKIIEYLGTNSLGVLLLHFLFLRMIFIIEYSVGTQAISILKQLTPFPNRFKGFAYTLTILAMFIFVNKKMENNNLYNNTVLGKFKFKINLVKSNKWKKILNILCISLSMLFIVECIPFRELYRSIHIGSDLANSSNLQGRFEDGFVGKTISGTFKSKDKGEMEIDIYSTEYTDQNVIHIFIDDNIVKEYNLNIGENKLKIEIPKNKIIQLKLNFDKTFIPADVSNSSDSRELSVVISKIKFN